MLKVTVLDIRRGYVKLGIDVADDVPVHRSEVWERIRAGDRRDIARPSIASSGA